MLFGKSAPKIRFLCATEDEGVIAPPVPARDYLPDWFRKLPAVDETMASKSDTGLTIKRCMPFLDAMTTGDPALGRYGPSRHPRRRGMGRGGLGFRQNHGQQPRLAPGARQPLGQAPAAQVPQLLDDRDAAGMELPDDRPAEPAERRLRGAFGGSGTDTYRSLIHFPFFATGPDGLHVIEKGSPLVQVIPFRRDATELAAEIGPEPFPTASCASASCATPTPRPAGTARRHAPSGDAASVSDRYRVDQSLSSSSSEFELELLLELELELLLELEFELELELLLELELDFELELELELLLEFELELLLQFEFELLLEFELELLPELEFEFELELLLELELEFEPPSPSLLLPMIRTLRNLVPPPVPGGAERSTPGPMRRLKKFVSSATAEVAIALVDMKVAAMIFFRRILILDPGRNPAREESRPVQHHT